MRHFAALLVAAFALCTATARAGNTNITIITIRPDGTCQIRTDTSQPRAAIERQVKMMERFGNGGELIDDDDPDPAAVAKSAAKAYTDEDLTAKLKEKNSAAFGDPDAESGSKIEVLEVTKETVHTVRTRAIASIDELLSSGMGFWFQSGLSFSNIRFETNSSSQLLVTMSPEPGMERYRKMARKEIKMSGMSSEFRIVFPGKVIASSFPNSEGNSTWLRIESADDASIDTATKLGEKPAVITSELNGLVLSKPIDSKNARRSNPARRGDSELPITDAGPGFVAEPASVTTSTLYVFPGGDKWVEKAGVFQGQTGVVVQANLFAPKGRSMRSVSDARVLKAVDDKNRTIGLIHGEVESDTDNAESMAFSRYSSFSSSGESEPKQISISLQLALPEKDAQAIQELSAEAVAITVGKWKELAVTNASGEVDLSSVLPGAKMNISNVKAGKNGVSAQVEIKGPPAIRQLEINAKLPSKQRFGGSNSNASERSFKPAADLSTRKLSLQAYSFDPSGTSPTADQLSFTVRYPDDLRRERVKFKLSGLDLF